MYVEITWYSYRPTEATALELVDSDRGDFTEGTWPGGEA